jgi:putative aldouronate transport system permease protein
MWNTLRISVFKFLFGWPAPIILALLLNEVRNVTFKKTVQTITFLPHFISWVMFAGLIYKLLDYAPDSPINMIRSLFGLDPIAIMGNQSAFIPILVVTYIIKEVGWGTIIYLAAISGIDPELYEAAVVDGGGTWVRIRHITLPGILPTIAILLVLSIPRLLLAGFDQVYNMKNPSVERLANITDIYVLRMGIIQGEYAYATALGLVFSSLTLILTLIANKISKGSVGTGIW